MDKFDYTVIGSGPGGYVSAIQAAQLGLKTSVVEKSQLGGVCLNWGCIPTKSLLEPAHFFHQLQKNSFGIKNIDKACVDVSQLIERSQKIIQKLSKGIEFLFKKNNITFIRGTAFIEDKNTISISETQQKITSKYICIATGSRPKQTEHLKFSKNILSYKEIVSLRVLPKKLLIIGGGVIGVEFADYFQCLGSQVTLIEIAEQIIPTEEPEISKLLKKELEKKGVLIFTSSQKDKINIKNLVDNDKDVLLEFQSKEMQRLKFDKALLCIGVEPNTTDFYSKKINFPIKNNRFDTNLFTQVRGFDHIFAIGDIASGKQLAHKASKEGIIAAKKAAGVAVSPMIHENIPSCIYTSPEIASIGYTKKELINKKISFKEGISYFNNSGRALAGGDSIGFLKTYLDKHTSEILGAHYIGKNVTELISTIALAKSSELLHEDLENMIFPHPTFSESILESMDNII